MRRGTALALLALAACGPERGAGVYADSAKDHAAQRKAAFAAGERLGLDGLREHLRSLGLRNSEIADAVDPDYDLGVLELRIGPERLAELDVQALAALELDSNYRLPFADPAVARAIGQSDVSYRRDMLAEIADLKRHGDWDRVPRLRAGESLASLARRIEHWCDFEPGGALRVIDGRWLEYSHAPVDKGVREPVPGPETARFLCLRRVVYATQLRRYFIGYRGEPPPVLYADDGQPMDAPKRR